MAKGKKKELGRAGEIKEFSKVYLGASSCNLPRMA